FRYNLLARSAVLACGASAAVLATQPALAQETQLQRVEITGSAVRRVDAEAALHVQVISKEDIAKTGVTSTEALLQSVSALASAGAVNNATGAGSATYGLSSISLRGLEQSRTLVLVNGRRLATFADGTPAVNVNVIPLSAIDRIEVLKDGASSLYGSDAMAGVVNFILARTFDGIEVGLASGTPTTSGGGQNSRLTLTAGVGPKDDARFSGVVSMSVEREAALFAKDRSFAASGNSFPYYTSAATGQGNIEGAVIPGAYPNDRVAKTANYPGFGTSPGTGYGNPMAAAGKCADINMFDAGLTSKGTPYCQFDSAAYVGLTPKRDLANLTGNFGVKINEAVELFADLMYSQSTVVQTYQPAPLRRSFATADNRLLDSGVDPSLIMYPGNPNYPNAYLKQYAPGILTAGPNGGPAPIAITSRVFDFGGRQTMDTATQTRLVGGVRGTIAQQDYEVAYMANRNALSGSYTGGVFSITDYNKIINDPASNWNPWGPGGVQTGALAAALATTQYLGGSLEGESKNLGLDAKISGEVFAMPGGAAQYALGFQQRKEMLTRTPADKPGTGDIAGAGGAAFAIDKDRNTSGIYAELNLPVAKGIEGNISARNDRYSDFGTANTYKVSGRWQPMKEVMVRASYNTGFRAPTLPDLYQPQILGNTEQFNDTGPGGSGQTDLQVNGITGGNPNLRPETSKAKSLGFVLAPTDNFSIGLDYFQISINDIIQTPGAQEVVSKFRAGDPAFAGLVTLNGNDIDTVKTITSNMGDASVAGVDIFASYRRKFETGQLDVGFNGTFMDKFDQTSPGGTLSHKVGTIVEADGTPVIGASYGGVILKWKSVLSATWTTGPWSTTVMQNFFDGYRAGNDLNDAPVYVPAQSLYDLNLTYRGIRNARLMLGIKNIFNEGPGVFVPVSNQFQAGYDITQYDPKGRFLYVSGTYKF
ncbi:MAG: TonB-dependent receptor, partial [Betaproteobacteria bacterium]